MKIALGFKRKSGKKGTIKRKIQTMMVLLIAFSLVMVSAVSCYVNYRATIESLKISLASTAKVAAGQVQYRMQAQLNIVETVGSMKRLGDSSVATAEKLSLIENYRADNSWNAAYLLDLDGTNLADSTMNFGDKDFFKTALTGVATFSDPVISKVTGKLVCFMAAPVYENGDKKSGITAVLMASMDASVLSDFVTDINASKNGSAIILNNKGTLVASKEYDMVLAETNCIEAAKTNPVLKPLAGLEEKMIAGETGCGTYGSNYLAYMPVEGTNGWSIGVIAPVSDFLDGTYMSIITTVIALVIALGISMVFASKMANSVGKPIRKCADRLEKLAMGDLQSEMPEINSNDETKELAESTARLMETLKLVIGDIDYLMDEMANRNLVVKSKAGEEAYVGELKTILLSMRTMNRNIADTLIQINSASEQVASGSEQLAGGATSLSQGATEQAASVEELAATINEISTKTGDNARHAAAAEQGIKSLGDNIRRSDDQMQMLIGAMQDINNASSEISKIIKTIEDIAFQTNILALNAAVEAARAGAAGKGFAVVADEVRNLAGKSAEAAKNTTALIERAIRSVEDGSHMVDETGESLNQVVQQTEGVLESMVKIIESTEQQAASVNQVTQGIDQISSVVQTNSSAAEESAATSQELSSQAELLKSLTSSFKLNR
jgi:methyl-accepting chemotaxis protein